MIHFLLQFPSVSLSHETSESQLMKHAEELKADLMAFIKTDMPEKTWLSP
jgi:hypothetical protein